MIVQPKIAQVVKIEQMYDLAPIKMAAIGESPIVGVVLEGPYCSLEALVLLQR